MRWQVLKNGIPVCVCDTEEEEEAEAAYAEYDADEIRTIDGND